MKEKTSKTPLSEGYLVADRKKCAGCIACMLACSLAHEGEVNPSLSRIQIVQTPFRTFPQDINIYFCRQCANPVCVKACPTGALRVDPAHGNLRVIEEASCDGCRQCLDACPFPPSRITWDHARRVALKCDLCLRTPYWEQGGPGGKQACVEVCPMRALAVTGVVPRQKGDEGYLVNLRNEHWEWLGFLKDEGSPTEVQKR
ncbi:MAG: 4Fe-4S dicluster domain-containing protein [Chloroflexi bacterium]|nr:4Fe-4S dicluster domain-containing protein [Chloroflexota bacterium]